MINKNIFHLFKLICFLTVVSLFPAVQASDLFKEVDIRFGNPKALKPIRLKYLCSFVSGNKNAPQIPGIKSLRFLKRPDDGRRVAVIEVRPGKPPVLNPKWTRKTFDGALSGPTVDYGTIPKLGELSLKEADSLWDNRQQNHSESGNEEVKRTYQLYSDYRDKADYFLDCHFVNNKLKKYRVRSTLTKTPDWIAVIN